MKTLSFTLFLLILSANIANAQHFQIRPNYSFQKMNVASQTGFSEINGSLYQQDFKWKAKSKFGLDITIGDRFYIQPGVKFSYLELNIDNTLLSDGSSSTIVASDKINITTIGVPLKAGYRFFSVEDDKNINFRIYGGLEGMIVTKVKHEMSNKIDEVKKEDFYPLILSGDFGLGMDVFFFYLETGYTFGLTPLLGADSPLSGSASTIFGSANPPTKTSMIYLTLGFYFGK